AFGWYHEKVYIVTGMICLALSILCVPEFKKNWKLYVLCGTYGLVCYYFQHSALVLRIALALLAGRRQKREHVVWFFFYGTLFIVVYSAVMSLLGLHNTVAMTDRFRSVEETRLCLGFYHPNSLSFFVYRVFILGSFLLNRDIKWKTVCFCILTVFCGTLIVLSDSKMGIAALLMTVVMCAIKRFLPDKIAGIVLFILSIASAAVQMILVIVFMLVKIPQPNIGEQENLWDILDSITTGRLWGAADVLQQNRFNLFGIKLVETLTEMGFANAVIQQGFVFFVLYSALFIILCIKAYKYRGKSAQIVFAGSAAYSMGESYLAYFNKNPLWFMLIGYENLIEEKNGEDPEQKP
ncbi:MAG: hypothetical protein K6G03_10825, partial [Lachnospiraceae bacterium]|nr:hypothetical protein [Lachnospiraceae bacterium]